MRYIAPEGWLAIILSIGSVVGVIAIIINWGDVLFSIAWGIGAVFSNIIPFAGGLLLLGIIVRRILNGLLGPGFW